MSSANTPKYMCLIFKLLFKIAKRPSCREAVAARRKGGRWKVHVQYVCHIGHILQKESRGHPGAERHVAEEGGRGMSSM